MDVAVSNAVGSALALEQMQMFQQAQTHLVRKVLDHQSDMITTLVQSAVPQLAGDGTLGTRVNTYA